MTRLSQCIRTPSLDHLSAAATVIPRAQAQSAMWHVPCAHATMGVTVSLHPAGSEGGWSRFLLADPSLTVEYVQENYISKLLFKTLEHTQITHR